MPFNRVVLSVILSLLCGVALSAPKSAIAQAAEDEQKKLMEQFFAAAGPPENLFMDPEALEANTFAYIGKTAIVSAEFVRMETSTEGRFTATYQPRRKIGTNTWEITGPPVTSVFVVNGIPANILERPGPVAVAGEVMGRININEPKSDVPLLSYKIIMLCKKAHCDDLFR